MLLYFLFLQAVATLLKDNASIAEEASSSSKRSKKRSQPKGKLKESSAAVGMDYGATPPKQQKLTEDYPQFFEYHVCEGQE